jgi:N-acetyl-anhydromuramyl-L-alanine amidase AmpD
MLLKQLKRPQLKQLRDVGMTVGLLMSLCMPALASATPAAAGEERASVFASAAQEFGVPQEVLLAVSYNESRWTPHGSGPSSDNGYGIMDLRTKTLAAPTDGRGDPTRPLAKQTTISGTYFTLDDASALLHVSQDTLKTDERQNIRGAAAVLADYARKDNKGVLPASLDDWYSAVAAYGGATNEQAAGLFADDVFATIQTGASLTTSDKQSLRIMPKTDVHPNHALTGLGLQASPMNTKNAGGTRVDCPTTLNCRFVPAAYVADDPNDPTNYGNYDPANRPKDMKIKYIVIHDTEGSYESAISWFQNPASYVSAHYVIRSSDGAITEMVRPSDVAWHDGDWYMNMHSIGIEHEGVAAQGATWYTEAMYRSSATLVRYLSAKYNIPLDRQHILGHDNIPTLSGTRMAGQHWDPGPYWDWNHYMDLLNAPITSGADVSARTKVVTIAPTFATNQQDITDCSSGTCTPLPAQGSNLVYLHTSPSQSAPLLSDPYLHTDNAPGTTHIEDWSATANSGDQYVVAGQQGDWTGVYYGGKVGWFYNPHGTQRTAHAATAKRITPRAGLTSIPVYGGAYPEASAYPADVPVQTLSPLYTLPAGQSYVTSGGGPTDYFYDATVDYSLPHDHMVVVGNEQYYRISFNHRQAFVKASDVVLTNR